MCGYRQRRGKGQEDGQPWEEKKWSGEHVLNNAVYEHINHFNQ